MSNVAQDRTMKEVGGGEGTNTTYLKLRPLKDTEAGKSIYKQLNTGDSVAGVYESSAMNNFDKLDFTIRLSNGSAIVVPGSGNLPYKMGQVQIGNYVEITYLGKSEIKSGKYKGKESHTFSVKAEAV